MVVVSRARWRCAPSGSCTAQPATTATGAQARRSGVTVSSPVHTGTAALRATPSGQDNARCAQ
ncbi:hypothetical protein ABZ568_33560, partial [Streptomyces olindensis]